MIKSKKKERERNASIIKLYKKCKVLYKSKIDTSFFFQGEYQAETNSCNYIFLPLK
jgi:hypothetical protein